MRNARAGTAYRRGMVPADAGSVRELLEAVVTAFSVLGGGMAYWSGFNAARALALEESPERLAHSINEGIGKGFEVFSLFSVGTLIIALWT